jgi:hypothetical protein
MHKLTTLVHVRHDRKQQWRLDASCGEFLCTVGARAAGRAHTDRLGEQGEMKERISEELRTTQRKRNQGTCKYFFTSFVVVFFGLHRHVPSILVRKNMWESDHGTACEMQTSASVVLPRTWKDMQTVLSPQRPTGRTSSINKINMVE